MANRPLSEEERQAIEEWRNTGGHELGDGHMTMANVVLMLTATLDNYSQSYLARREMGWTRDSAEIAAKERIGWLALRKVFAHVNNLRRIEFEEGEIEIIEI